MKLVVLVLFGLVTEMLFAAQPTYAQRFTVEFAPVREAAVTPTPTPKVAPTTTPVPTVVPTSAPEPTAVPQVQTNQNTANAEPTPTPKFVSPVASYLVTPTPKPKIAATTTKKKTPPTEVAKLITAPLSIAKTVLPTNYYDEQRLDPKTTNNLLLFAGSSLLLGTLLLAWPSLVELRNRIFASFHREGKIVYLHSGKGLLKA